MNRRWTVRGANINLSEENKRLQGTHAKHEVLELEQKGLLDQMEKRGSIIKYQKLNFGQELHLQMLKISRNLWLISLMSLFDWDHIQEVRDTSEGIGASVSSNLTLY